MQSKWREQWNSRKNGTTASIRLHGHDTLVEKYDAISLVWTEVKWQVWIYNHVDDRQTSHVVLPLTRTAYVNYLTLEYDTVMGNTVIPR